MTALSACLHTADVAAKQLAAQPAREVKVQEQGGACIARRSISINFCTAHTKDLAGQPIQQSSWQLQLQLKQACFCFLLPPSPNAPVSEYEAAVAEADLAVGLE